MCPLLMQIPDSLQKCVLQPHQLETQLDRLNLRMAMDTMGNTHGLILCLLVFIDRKM